LPGSEPAVPCEAQERRQALWLTNNLLQQSTHFNLPTGVARLIEIVRKRAGGRVADCAYCRGADAVPRSLRQDHEALHLHGIRFTGQGHLLGSIGDQMLRSKKSIDLPGSRSLSNGKKVMVTGDGKLSLRSKDQAARHHRADVELRVQRAGKPAGNTDIRGRGERPARGFSSRRCAHARQDNANCVARDLRNK
jgi:hypothetical protein